MSSGPRRLTSSFVRRPRRAVPRMAVAVASTIAGRLVPGALGRLQQLPCVTASRLVPIVRPQHADDLRDEPVAVDTLDDRSRLATPDILLDSEMGPGERGNLREVGDAEDLTLLSEVTE